MKMNANDIRPGNMLLHKDKLWQVAKIQHTQPGKGGAYIQAEMKCITDGTKLNERFRSTETVEKARLDQKDYQFLYQEGGMIHMMDGETYEQIALEESLAGGQLPFLNDGMTVSIEMYESTPLMLHVPEHMTFEVTEAEPVVKGQTAASSNKPAILENGVRVMVPPFVGIGDKIIINTQEITYVKRAD